MNKESTFSRSEMEVTAIATTSVIKSIDELLEGRIGKIELDLGEHTLSIITKRRRKTVKKVAKKTAVRKTVKKTAVRKTAKKVTKRNTRK